MASNLTIEDQALLDYGQNQFKSSLDTIKDFCKTMMNFSIGGVTLYIAIIGILKGQNGVPQETGFSYVYYPIVGFVASSLLFILGYMPYAERVDLSDLERLKKHRERALKHHYTFSLLGLIAFIIAIFYVFGNVVYFKQYWK
jgi:hypothetical protein